MKKFFVLSIAFILLGSFLLLSPDNACTDDGLKQLGVLGAKGDVKIKVYGRPMTEQPFTVERHTDGYHNVVIHNPHGRTLEVRSITDAVDMSHFGTHDGKWKGYRVVKLVVE